MNKVLASPPIISTAAANAAAASFAALLTTLDYLDTTEIEQIRQAYRYADAAHLGQLRDNGEPYITHPIAVAAQCAAWKLDTQALMAALLHDAMEDCGVRKSDLIERFGTAVAELVDGLTKLDKLHFNTREESQAESFRKMLLAMSRDVRVILIKIADRLHNMRTLKHVRKDKWGRTATETLDIYAPIAHRLGLNQAYRELQELSLQYQQPWRHAVLSKALARARSRRRDLLQKVRTELEAGFAAVQLPVRLNSREKSLFSIYGQMQAKRLSFAQVTDIYGFRLIVPTTLDCYTALGVLHQLYKPLPGKFRDYIALPKINGYQSLHTTLVGPSGINVEFQLRTQSMDAVAESGVVAHWIYKVRSGNGDAGTARQLGTQWLQSLLDIQHETRDATEFWDHIKVDLFTDSVYVFTPRSQILSLPRGATVVDFAYAVHSNIGHRVVAARINGEAVPLRTELKNGDVVEVITSEQSAPHPSWLDFVRTGRARSKIRHYLKTMAHAESEALGTMLLAQALRAEGFDPLPAADAPGQSVWDKLLRFTGNPTRTELLTDIGLGKRIASIVAKRLARLLLERGDKPDPLLLTQERFSAHEKGQYASLTLDGSENASVKFAICCYPLPGESIVAYLGRGEGLVVHTDDCAVARRLLYKDSERFIPVNWAEQPVRSFDSRVHLTVKNEKGVLARVAAALSAAEVNINHVDMDNYSDPSTTELRFVIAVHNRSQLDAVMHQLRHLASVQQVLRIKSAAADRPVPDN